MRLPLDMIYFTIVGFILGFVLGSFSKVLADRSLKNQSFLGRSFCPKCKKVLGLWDLIPIFSYLFLNGKCRYCQKVIDIEYLLVEVFYGLVFALIFWQAFFPITFLDWINLLFKIFFVTVLGIVALTDLKSMLIPDRVILPSIIILAVAQILMTLYKIGYLYLYLNSSQIGKLLVQNDYFFRHALISVQNLAGFFLSALGIAGFFMLLIAITRGKGMGGGDVKLGAFMGLMLGFPYSVVAVMLAFFSGAIVALFLVVAGKKSFKESLPFGPFLVLGSLITLFWGQLLLDKFLL